MSWFRKSLPEEPLAVTMTGVKLGDRLLAAAVADAKLAAALAIKSGLTGRAAVVDASDDRLRAVAAAIEREGALIEPTHAPWNAWPFDAESFDLVVIGDLFATLGAEDRVAALDEVFRVLRSGGRVVAIESTPRGGIRGVLGKGVHPDYARSGGAQAALSARGFSGVRVLAERGGTTYLEAAKRT